MPDSNNKDSEIISSTKKDELRVKNVSELQENSNEATPDETPAQTKRKLPAWMVSASCCSQNDQSHTEDKVEESSSKRLKTDENLEGNSDAGSTTSTFREKAPNGEEVPNTSNKNTEDAPNLSSIKTEQNEENDVQSTIKDANDSNVSTNATNTADVKNEHAHAEDTTATTSANIQNCNDIKPAVKVEKADASSTSRESCKFGIRCYRRNPMHRIEEAHPGDHDYKRPQYPSPPLGTPACPYGNMCYRRNPTHFQSFSHPADTDFQKNYRLRQRRRQQQQQQNNTNSDNSDLDDYDLDDPFINDDSDQDYVPSDDDIEDTEELDYDDGDKAEE